jgi:hypothetical protein
MTLLSGECLHPDIAGLRIRITNIFRSLFCQTKSPEALRSSLNAWVTPPALAGESRQSLHSSEVHSQSFIVQHSKSGSTGNTNRASSSSPVDKISPVNLKRLHKICRNEAGQRVDSVLNVDDRLVHVIAQANLCHHHYLRADCKTAFTDCPYNHKFRRNLSPGEYDGLWSLSRQNACRRAKKDKFCDDDQCIFGHKHK